MFENFIRSIIEKNKKTYDLGHFENAQENFWDTAYAEISAGRKETHWIWYIFPQLKGFGVSKVSEDYGISGIEEARQYLSNEYLHNNLVTITKALLNCGKDDIHDIVSYPDDLKIRSCMTLFYCAADVPEDKELFSDVIYKYYGGVFDDITIRKLQEEKP